MNNVHLRVRVKNLTIFPRYTMRVQFRRTMFIVHVQSHSNKKLIIIKYKFESSSTIPESTYYTTLGSQIARHSETPFFVLRV